MSKTYYVVSAVRSVHTRLARAQAPERHRFKQFILGGTVRLVRNRPVPITEEMLEKHSEELRQKNVSGALIVRVGSPDGPLYEWPTKGHSVREVIEAQKEVMDLVDKTPVKSEPKKKEPTPKKEVEEKVDIDDVPPPPTKKRKKKGKG